MFFFCFVRTTPTHPTSEYDCNFETDQCSTWSITSKPELSWTRVRASQAVQNDAHNPSADHTASQIDGYYLLLQPNTTAPYPNVCENQRKQTNDFKEFFFKF